MKTRVENIKTRVSWSFSFEPTINGRQGWPEAANIAGGRGVVSQFFSKRTQKFSVSLRQNENFPWFAGCYPPPPDGRIQLWFIHVIVYRLQVILKIIVFTMDWWCVYRNMIVNIYLFEKGGNSQVVSSILMIDILPI